MNRSKPLSLSAHSAAPVTPAPDLLLPITGAEPCGASLEYDAEYAVLQSRMTPRGDAQYGKFVGVSEAPNWAEIERDCRRLLLRTKDVTLFVWLCRARTRLGQAAGLAQVLATLAAVLKAWPEAVHPQLVVEGQFDPEVRANALAALGDPDGLLSDVRDIAVASHTALRLTVRDVERAFAVPRSADAPLPEAVNRQLAALRAAAADDPGAPVNLLAQAAREARAIEAWSRSQLGDSAPASLKGLVRLLDLFLAPPVLRHAEPASEPAAATTAAVGLATRSQHLSEGTTRQDVLYSIRAAREWLEVHEPSSPVAVLLKQAERMVGKRFSQVADSIPLELLKKWESEDDTQSPGVGS